MEPSGPSFCSSTRPAVAHRTSTPDRRSNHGRRTSIPACAIALCLGLAASRGPPTASRRGWECRAGCTRQSEKACVKISACPTGQQPLRLSPDGIGFCEEHHEPPNVGLPRRLSHLSHAPSI
jgi:hypothetical protein